MEGIKLIPKYVNDNRKPLTIIQVVSNFWGDKIYCKDEEGNIKIISPSELKWFYKLKGKEKENGRRNKRT